ncbi:MAG: hypothetical protein N2038_14950 [Geminicoccaceae bacterium]|nr:hypothetical protein [Geminicoccaceae bacterium]
MSRNYCANTRRNSGILRLPELVQVALIPSRNFDPPDLSGPSGFFLVVLFDNQIDLETQPIAYRVDREERTVGVLVLYRYVVPRDGLESFLGQFSFYDIDFADPSNVEDRHSLPCSNSDYAQQDDVPMRIDDFTFNSCAFDARMREVRRMRWVDQYL